MSSKTKTAQKQDAKPALTPKLRFPEFQEDEEWDEGALSGLAKSVKTKATKVSEDDVLTLSGEHGLVRQTEYFGKQIAGKNLDRYLKIQRDDFVYNDRTTSASKFGTIKRLKNYSVGAVSPIYKCFRFPGDQLSEFWDYYFEAGAHEPALGEYVNEGARAGRFNISVDTILSITVCYPSPSEQQKIADCLCSLDDLIAAHSAKLEALQDHKKGLMQQLFPREGETLPRLRFPEFQGTPEWEVMRMEQIGRVIRGASPRPKGDPRYYVGPIPRLMVQDVTRDGKWVTPRIDSLTEAGARLSRPCPAGTLTIVCSGSVGVVSFLAVDACIHDGFLALIDIDESIATKDFIFHTLSTLREQFEKSATHGGVFTNLTTTGINLFEINCPCLPEQQRIASCLTALDALISAQTDQIAALKEQRRG